MRDLLNPSTKGNLKVREHPATGPYVEDLAKLVVASFSEIENLMDEGNKARTVAATNMNETSSRSHAVFTLILSQKRHDAETNMDTEKVSRISLVDLAGSERANSTGATGARLKEGAEINRSLSTLGRVIAALADLGAGKLKGKNAARQVPYRDSVLTWLLKDSLGGNSMTAMIAAISPADINFDETLSTLRYADSAKRIKNHAVVNEDPNARMIRELKEELQQLRQKLSGGGGGGGGVPEDEQYAPDTPLEKQMVSIAAPDGTVKKVSKAEIAEQLTQSEKILTDLNQTWEQKLEKTELIHKEREAALEELGISIEKGFIGLSTPKRMPHLVNLSDDPLLAECLVYNIKPGTTLVGNVETSTTAQIRLNGSKILQEHCRFENENGVVTLVPNESAAVMVNGIRMEKARRLRTGYRIILGDFHIFRFNHPQEARAERDRLRQSATINSAQSPEHMRTPSNGFTPEMIKEIDSDGNLSSRPESPAGAAPNSRDMEWSFARREAASAWLGDSSKINTLTDDELDGLLEEMQRVKAIRQGRPDSRFGDDETESVMSYPGVRERYLSTGTFDDMSLDTMITMPSTPAQGEVEERLRLVRQEMQGQLERQKQEYQEKLRRDEEDNIEFEEYKAEKQKMQEKLDKARKEMQRELEKQRQEFEVKLEEITLSPSKKEVRKLSSRETSLARYVIEHWRQRKYVRMAESILQFAATLKEAQIMSNEMEKNVVFQFTIVDEGHTFASSYDLVLNGISAEDDEFLDMAKKPCVGVRVMDFHAEVVHLWSLEKLQNRVRQMRQIYQYLDRPEYLQHFRLGDPFSEPILPQYSLIGDIDVPLTAIFEARSQAFALDVMSPYTSSVVGIIKLVLEPSNTDIPPSIPTLKFNIHMKELIGFAEREGTEVHAQMFIPGVSDESGATTTTLVTQFDEGPVRFDSVHSMTLALGGPLRNSCLRVAIFAKITAMHLEKLMSWDDMRDHNRNASPRKKRTPRINETEFYTEERHDVFTRVQILELSESGEYLPVEVVQSSDLDSGAFQLRQGLQRRVQLSLTHSSGDALQWGDVRQLRMGAVRLLDPRGKMPDLSSPTKEVPLSTILGPVVKANTDGTSTLTVVAQWDSSLHNSILLDRTTADKYRVQMGLRWAVTSERLSEPILFSLDLNAQIMARGVRSPNKFMQLWNTNRVVHAAVGLYQLVIRPAAARRAGDLWRMNTQFRYVKGEEYLQGWTPRGVSLVKDFIVARKRKVRVAEVENAKGFLSSLPATRSATPQGLKRRGETATATAAAAALELVRPEEVPLPPDVPEKPTAATNGTHVEEFTDDNNAQNGAPSPPPPPPPPSPPPRDDALPPSTTPMPQSPVVDDSAVQPVDDSAPPTPPEDIPLPASAAGSSVAPSVASDDSEIATLRKFIDLWTSYKDPSEVWPFSSFSPMPVLLTHGHQKILTKTNTEPPPSGVPTSSSPRSLSPPPKPRLMAECRHVAKSAQLLKSGYLLTPDPSTGGNSWRKMYFELRRPYLHAFSVPDGDEVGAINLSQCRIDHQPQVARELRIGGSGLGTGLGDSRQDSRQGGGGGGGGGSGGNGIKVWAVYAHCNTHLFATRSEREMIEWIMKIDQFHFFPGAAERDADDG